MQITRIMLKGKKSNDDLIDFAWSPVILLSDGYCMFVYM